MLTRYISQTIIAAKPSYIWQTITQQNFTKNYLPEIKRNFNNPNSTAPYTYHQNPDEILPAYVVAEKTISWDNNANTSIQLTRRDLRANIESITIDLVKEGNATKVTIEVNYQPKLNKHFLLTHISIRSLFNYKLTVLKRDIESKLIAANYAPIYIVNTLGVTKEN